jgi:5-methyltetrahydrofolate--homocysteine methyltransferase
LTNTFQANGSSLRKCGLEFRLEEIVRAGVELARSGAGADGWVLGDIGPFPPEEAPDTLPLLLNVFQKTDAVLFETFSDCDVLGRILDWTETRSLPILFSATYRKTRGVLETACGLPPREVARAAEELGVAAVGVNCGLDIDMDDACAILREYRRATNLPLFARPNAGTPTRQGKRWLYPRSAEDMARKIPALVEAGARMIGGCCGTAPRYIAEFRKMIEQGRDAVKP